MRLVLGMIVTVLAVGCRETPPTPQGPPTGSTASPTTASAVPPKEDAAVTAPLPVRSPIFQAFIATDVASMMKATTPAAAQALPRTVFILLGEPATIRPDQKAITYIIAREATFDVVEDGRAATPQPFTSFAGGAPCVGHAERKVLIRTKPDDTAPERVEHGLVLEGCAPPAMAYSLFVAEGAHPGGKPIEAVALAKGAGPSWATGTPRMIYRFARAPEPLFVVVRELDGGPTFEWQVGTNAKPTGTILVPRDFDPPTMVDLGSKAYIVSHDAVIDADRVVRVSTLQR
jgi:hypothetical protein